MNEIILSIWLCVTYGSSEGSLLEGHLPAHKAKVLMSTVFSFGVGECASIKVDLSKCVYIRDEHSVRYRDAYLCDDDSNVRM